MKPQPMQQDSILDGLAAAEDLVSTEAAAPGNAPPFAATPALPGPRAPDVRLPSGNGAKTAGGDTGVMELPEPQGFVVRRSPRRARKGWYAPMAVPSLTSTRQAEILNTALVAAPTDAVGTLIGRDLLSNTPVAHD